MSRFDRFTKSNNPVMKEKVLQRASASVLDGDMAKADVRPMTVQGAINKTYVLFAIMLATSVLAYIWANFIVMIVGAIAGLIVVILAVRAPHKSATYAPVYAALEGFFVGSVTAFYAASFSGIIFQAVTLTFAILFVMLFIYKSGIIKVTSKFRTGVIMATGAVLVVYVLNFVLSMFGIQLPFLHEGGMFGIGISLVIIGIASLNLLLDFDNFEKGEQYGAPDFMEWFYGMGLLITLVWIYVEILRLLAIFSSSD